MRKDQHSMSLDVPVKKQLAQNVSIGPSRIACTTHPHDNHHWVHSSWSVFDEVPDVAHDLLPGQVWIPHSNSVQERPPDLLFFGNS